MSDARPWYDLAFEDAYPEVYPHRDLEAARREVAGLVARGVGGRVLDLGCGFGRHLQALREHGLEAFGLDRSAALLRRTSAELRARVVRGDFRRLPFRSGAFETVVMLFSSFGYFDDEDNARTLHELRRVLGPDGSVVLDLMNPGRVRANLVAHSVRRQGELEIDERRSLAAGGTRVVKDVLLRSHTGAVRSWREDVRLYEPPELRELLERAGLVLVRTEGDFDGRPFASDAPRQIVWARGSAPR